MILYFSGTGNSRYISEVINSILNDEIVCINDYLKNNQKSYLKPLAFIKKMSYTSNSANVCVHKNVISNYKHMRCLL